MEVLVPPATVDGLLYQLQGLNRTASAFGEVFADYQGLLRQCRELQVRCAQLDKEAGELRNENAVLHSAAEQVRKELVNSVQVTAAEAKIKELSQELNGTLRDKARLAEELATALRQLDIVRQNNDQQTTLLQAKELLERTESQKELRGRVHGLTTQLEQLQSAHVTATSEMQGQIKARQEAQDRVSTLSNENTMLIQRLLEEKERTVERMNETQRMCDDMLAHAREKERLILAKVDEMDRQGASMRNNSMLSRMSSGMRSQGGSLDGSRRQSSDPQSFVAPEPAVTVALPESAHRSISAHMGEGFTVAFDRSGAQLASGGADKVIRLWDTHDGRMTGKLEGMVETVTDLAFLADSQSLMAAGSDFALRMFNLETSRVRHTFTGHTRTVTSVDCNPASFHKDALQAVSSSTDRCVKVWDLTRGHMLQQKMWGSTPNAVRYTPDGALVASGHHDGTLRFWDFRLKKLANEVAGLHTREICSVAIGRRTGLTLTCGKDNALRLVDSRTFQVRQMLTAPGFAIGTIWCTVCLSADEAHAAAGSANGSVYVWEVDSGKLVRTLKVKSTQNIQATAWSPQGSPLVSLDKSGVLVIWQ